MMMSFIAPLPRAARVQRRRRPCTCTQQPPSKPGDNSMPTPGGTPQSAKERLLKLLPALINIPAQSAKVAALIGSVEAGLQPPATAAFTELAVSGAWRLLFSSALPVRANASSMRLRTITQTINGGTLDNHITVTWVPRPDAEIEATLRVSCTYEFVGAARMHVKLLRHAVEIDSRSEAATKLPPEHLEAMVEELQRALPTEIWDPSGLIDTTSVAPDFRIARFVGKRLAGVRNIFVPADTPFRFPVNR